MLAAHRLVRSNKSTVGTCAVVTEINDKVPHKLNLHVCTFSAKISSRLLTLHINH